MFEVETVVLESYTSESAQWSVDFEKLPIINSQSSMGTITSPPVHLKIGSRGTLVKCILTFHYSYAGQDKFTVTIQELLPNPVNSLKFSLDALCYRQNQQPNEPEKIQTYSNYFDLLTVRGTTFEITFPGVILSGYQANNPAKHEANSLLAFQAYRIVFILSTETKEFRHNISKQHTTNVAMTELVADLQNLYQTMDHADVTLKVGTTKILAHKNILTARCKAFAAMLKDGVDEIDTRDMTEDVLKELLRYFYTGKVEKLDLALDLVKIAKASDITHLVYLCEQHLEKNMTVKNCLDVLTVAHEFNIKDLKSFTLKYIVTTIKYVQKLDGWVTFINNYPELAVDLFAQLTNTGM